MTADIPKRAYRLAMLALVVALSCLGLDVAGIDPHFIGEAVADALTP